MNYELSSHSGFEYYTNNFLIQPQIAKFATQKDILLKLDFLLSRSVASFIWDEVDLVYGEIYLYFYFWLFFLDYSNYKCRYLCLCPL